MITVKHHRGRSGKSVFAWRVYSVADVNGNGSRIVRTQLGKYRTEEAANRAADFHRQRAAALKEIWLRHRNVSMENPS